VQLVVLLWKPLLATWSPLLSQQAIGKTPRRSFADDATTMVARSQMSQIGAKNLAVGTIFRVVVLVASSCFFATVQGTTSCDTCSFSCSEEATRVSVGVSEEVISRETKRKKQKSLLNE